MRSPDQTVGPWSGKRGGLVYPGFGGRLTLTSATPVTTADVTAAASLYYTEHTSDLVTLPWRRGKWETFALPKNSAGVAEIKADFLANSPWALANATVYDVFLKLGVAGPELVRGPAWSSATARTTGLMRRQGIWTLATDPMMVYVGTIYASAANQCEDSAAKRFVWNAYNLVPRFMSVIDTTNSWTYSTATWQQANASAANLVAYVTGLASTPAKATVAVSMTQSSGSTSTSVGVGVDSTTTNSALLVGLKQGAVVQGGLVHARYAGYPGLGYHYLAWLEIASGGVATFYGDNGLAYFQGGLMAEIMG